MHKQSRKWRKQVSGSLQTKCPTRSRKDVPCLWTEPPLRMLHTECLSADEWNTLDLTLGEHRRSRREQANGKILSLRSCSSFSLACSGSPFTHRGRPAGTSAPPVWGIPRWPLSPGCSLWRWGARSPRSDPPRTSSNPWGSPAGQKKNREKRIGDTGW